MPYPWPGPTPSTSPEAAAVPPRWSFRATASPTSRAMFHFRGERRLRRARDPAIQQFQHRGRRHHHHQCVRPDHLHRQQHRRLRALHHQCRRRGGFLRDDRTRRQQPSHGRLDGRRRHLQSRLRHAHRRDQRAEHHGERHHQRRRGERRRGRFAGQARRRDADLVGREHLYRPDGGPGRHAAGRGDQCLRGEQRVHGHGRRHARSRELRPDHRLARRRRQRDARLGHADHRQQQYQHDVLRHDVRRRRRTDQGRRRHADAFRQQQLFRRDGGQRRHAAGRRGECILGGQRVHGREQRNARSRRLQPDHRLARRRRQRDARLCHADRRQRQYQHGVLRHDVRRWRD